MKKLMIANFGCYFWDSDFKWPEQCQVKIRG